MKDTKTTLKVSTKGNGNEWVVIRREQGPDTTFQKMYFAQNTKFVDFTRLLQIS
jgi:hypothetical protein